MANRAMQAKVAKAKAERTEYAVQAMFKDVTMERGPVQMLNGKMVPRPDTPKVLDDMVDDYLSHRPIKRASCNRVTKTINKSATVRAAFDNRSAPTYAQLRAIFGK